MGAEAVPLASSGAASWWSAIRAADVTTQATLLAAVGTLLLVVVTLFAVLVAIGQARAAIRQSREAQDQNVIAARALAQSTSQSRVQTLLALKQLYNSSEMKEATEAMYVLMDKVYDEVKRAENESVDELRARQALKFSEYLANIEKIDPQRYRNMQRCCFLSEFLGYIVMADLMPKQDIIEFFGGALLEIADVYAARLRDQAAAAHATGKEFEHSLWLFDEVQAVAEEALANRRTQDGNPS